MSAQLRRSARKRKPTEIALAASRQRPRRESTVTSVATTQLHQTVSSASASTTLVYGTPAPLFTTGMQHAGTSAAYTMPLVTTASLPTTASLQPDTLLYTRLPVQSDPVPGNCMESVNSLGNQTPASTLTMSSVNINALNQPCQVPSIHVDLGFNVPQNLRKKIQKSDYIDLAVLLSNNYPTQNSQKLVFKEGELTVQTENNRNKISSIEQWTSAFIIFISVYCMAHPSRCQELLKYMSDVRLGAKRNNGLGWKFYDEQYRLRKQANPASSWSLVDVELWLLYMAYSYTPNSSLAFAGYRSYSLNGNLNKRLKCYAFNHEGKCYRPLCPYSHSCLYCNGVHPVVTCQLKLFNNEGFVQQKQFNSVRQHYNPRLPKPELTNSQNFTFRQQHQNPRARPPVSSVGPRPYTYMH